MTGATVSLPPQPAPTPVLAQPSERVQRLFPAFLSRGAALPILAMVLVTAPVFIQAPWVRVAPAQALLFTIPLLTAAILLERNGQGEWSSAGALLVGFCGTWVGGCLFWGWFRVHPGLHLPVEGFALPLALAGLGSRWRLAAAFYLASLLGTALTDGVMALAGIMRLWPVVLSASPYQAPILLQSAALRVLEPLPLTLVAVAAAAILSLGEWMGARDQAWRVASATLRTTLLVDALFLAAALASPHLSGLI